MLEQHRKLVQWTGLVNIKTWPSWSRQVSGYGLPGEATTKHELWPQLERWGSVLEYTSVWKLSINRLFFLKRKKKIFYSMKAHKPRQSWLRISKISFNTLEPEPPTPLTSHPPRPMCFSLADAGGCLECLSCIAVLRVTSETSVQAACGRGYSNSSALERCRLFILSTAVVDGSFVQQM